MVIWCLLCPMCDFVLVNSCFFFFPHGIARFAPQIERGEFGGLVTLVTFLVVGGHKWRVKQKRKKKINSKNTAAADIYILVQSGYNNSYIDPAKAKFVQFEYFSLFSFFSRCSTVTSYSMDYYYSLFIYLVTNAIEIAVNRVTHRPHSSIIVKITAKIFLHNFNIMATAMTASTMAVAATI